MMINSWIFFLTRIDYLFLLKDLLENNESVRYAEYCARCWGMEVNKTEDKVPVLTPILKKCL